MRLVLQSLAEGELRDTPRDLSFSRMVAEYHLAGKLFEGQEPSSEDEEDEEEGRRFDNGLRRFGNQSHHRCCPRHANASCVSHVHLLIVWQGCVVLQCQHPAALHRSCTSARRQVGRFSCGCLFLVS